MLRSLLCPCLWGAEAGPSLVVPLPHSWRRGRKRNGRRRCRRAPRTRQAPTRAMMLRRGSFGAPAAKAAARSSLESTDPLTCSTGPSRRPASPGDRASVHAAITRRRIATPPSPAGAPGSEKRAPRRHSPGGNRAPMCPTRRAYAPVPAPPLPAKARRRSGAPRRAATLRVVSRVEVRQPTDFVTAGCQAQQANRDH